MKQLLQRLDSGETMLIEAPVPSASGINLLVEARASLISAGTERMLVQFGRANLLDKARSQPDKVVQVLEKVRADGLMPTVDAVRSKLAMPIPLGYCNAGVVVGAGAEAGGFTPGTRVVTNGPHAEYVRVPYTLAARIPDGVDFERAAFAPVAAIALQGIRLAAPSLGETVVVYGLGLIGLMAIQLLKANGCRVVGIDTNGDRLAQAAAMGAEPVDPRSADVVAAVLAATAGEGADAVLLTLASSSDEPVHNAALMSRKRGRLVVVGATGLKLVRDDFYKKELSLTVSSSYGPGRYDPAYEELGHDYPRSHVRWTAQRNFDAVLALMAEGRLDPLPLVTHRFEFAGAADAYELIQSDRPSLGVLLGYPDRGGAAPEPESRTIRRSGGVRPAGDACTVAVVGAGNFAVRTLLPVLRGPGVRLKTIVSGGGVGAAVAGDQFGFEQVASRMEAVLDDPEVDAVFLLTPHDSHGSLTARALAAGKHVFVEKPLATTLEDLELVESAAAASDRLLMVGFNRRFAPLAREARRLLEGRSGPLSLVLTVNAGAMPADHWMQDWSRGGGRIIGEGCHFVDLARYFVGAPIVGVDVVSARDTLGSRIDDVSHLSLAFADGSTAVVHYLANGSKAYPKERVDFFFDGKTLVLDNWRRLHRYGIRGGLLPRPRRQAKGHAEEIRAWVDALRTGGPPPIPAAELFEVSRWTIHAGALARFGHTAGAGGDEPIPAPALVAANERE